jgi:hypothetical protein
MIVCHAARLIMLLPWKTASQTIRARLANDGVSPYPVFHAFNPALGRVASQHLTMADFAALPEAALGYRMAVFVRNPYDRVVSGFAQFLRDTQWQPGAQFPEPWIRNLIVEGLAANLALIDACGRELNAWIGRLPEQKVLDVRDCTLPLHPACYWTHRDARLAVDFVGRVESFEADFGRLCAAYSLRPGHAQNENESPALPARPDAHGYRYAHLLSAGSISRINRLFAQDFDAFGYARL